MYSKNHTRITFVQSAITKSTFAQKLLTITPIIISAVTLVSTIVFSFVISKEREFSKIKYDQQLLTYSKLLNIARDLKGEAGKDVDTIYNANLSKFDMITSGELLLIAEQNVIDNASDFREDVSAYNSNRTPPNLKSLDDDYKKLVNVLKASMENTQN